MAVDPSEQRRKSAYSQARLKAVKWVQANHPDVWQQMVAEANLVVGMPAERAAFRAGLRQRTRPTGATR
jgi:hypothetical protein